MCLGINRLFIAIVMFVWKITKKGGLYRIHFELLQKNYADRRVIMYFNDTWLCNGFLKNIITGLKNKTVQNIALDASLSDLAKSYSSLKPINGVIYGAAIKNAPRTHYTIENITNSTQSVGYLTNLFKARNANFYEKKIILKTPNFKIPSALLEEPTSSIEEVLSEKIPLPLNALVILTPIEDIDETALNSELYRQKKLIDEEVAKSKALCARLGQDPVIVDQVISKLTHDDSVTYATIIQSIQNPHQN